MSVQFLRGQFLQGQALEGQTGQGQAGQGQTGQDQQDQTGQSDRFDAGKAPFQSQSQPQTAICPGLFCPAVAQDGYLVRIRVPGGRLTPAQCRVLAGVAAASQAGSLEVTNRANLQLRGLAEAMPAGLLGQLQAVQLAAPPAIDHLRNLMASPTAGIDLDQILDTRPLVAALNDYLIQRRDWAELSAKFSVGFDGGERVSIQQQPNDLLFTAVRQTDGVGLHLRLAGLDPDQGSFLIQFNGADSEAAIDPVLAAVDAVVQIYLDAVEPNLERQPRLKQVLSQVAGLPQRLQDQLDFPLRPARPLPSPAPSRLHLGVHAQRQPGLSYVGVALPLGELTVPQLQQLADLAEVWQSGLRLTPWRTLILSDLPGQRVEEILPALAEMGLRLSANPVWGNLVACAGLPGCAASATDTRADALALAKLLEARLDGLDIPTVHLSGCSKSCAHHGSSDITLVGVKTESGAGYQLYLGDRDKPGLGRQIMPMLRSAELPEILARLLALQSQTGTGQIAAAELETQLGGS